MKSIAHKPLFFLLLSFLLYEGKAQELKFNNVSNTHLPAVSLAARNNSMDAKTGDIDKDGDLDLIVAVEFYKNVILLNDGNGKFTNGSDRLPDLIASIDPKPYRYYPYHDSEDIALEDFDNDGDLDMVIVTEDDEINEYYVNDGAGNFSNKSNTLPTNGVSNGVLAHDFDKDGWIDVVLANNGQNHYWKNNKGNFINDTEQRLPAGKDISQDMQALDFDQDGDMDIIVANEQSNALLLNDGKGSFTDATASYFNPKVLAEETREATFADVDNDGDYDFYFANVKMFQGLEPVQRFLINKGNGEFVDEMKERLGFTSEHSIIDALFHDIDNDKDLDLLLITLNGPKLFENNGEGYFTDVTEVTIGTIEGFGVDAEIADFNNDGKADIFISCYRRGDILLLQE